MPTKNQKELFVRLLSNVRHATERSTKIYQEMSQAVQEPRIKQALEARLFISNKIVSTLDECFNLIGERPIQSNERLQEIFLEDFRRELTAIQAPEGKVLFVLYSISQLIHLRMGELVALVAAADMTGNYGVGVLIESCLADKVAFNERTHRFIRHYVEERVAEKRAA